MRPRQHPFSLDSHPSRPIYPKVELRTVGQHHAEQPRQRIAGRHVPTNEGEVIMITTNGMVEISSTLLLAHIDNFFPKISFRAMIILANSTCTRGYQYRNAFAASQHGIIIIRTSVPVAIVEDANLINHLLRDQKDIGIYQIHHLRHAASASTNLSSVELVWNNIPTISDDCRIRC